VVIADCQDLFEYGSLLAKAVIRVQFLEGFFNAQSERM